MNARRRRQPSPPAGRRRGRSRRAACTSASGRRTTAARDARARGRRVGAAGTGDRRSSARRDGYFSRARCRTPAPARATASALDGDATLLPGPGVALPAGGPARPVGGRRSRRASAWTDAAWPGVTLAGQVLYEMHVGTFTPEGTWRGRRARAAELRRPRHHRRRDDAGRRVSRALRLGLRRRRPVRADAPLRHARTTSARFVDRAHALGLGVILDVVYNHLGPDGNYLAAFSPTYFTDRYDERVGRGAQLRRRRTRGRCASSSSRTPATGSTSSTSTACASTPRSRSSTPRPSTSSPRSAGARAAAAGRAVDRSSSPRTSRRTRGSSGRRRRAATASTRCGTTTSTTAPMVALTGRTEAYYTDYRGTPQEFISAAKYGYLYQGQRYSLAEEAPRHAGARTCRPRAFVDLPREPRPGRQLGARPARCTS